MEQGPKLVRDRYRQPQAEARDGDPHRSDAVAVEAAYTQASLPVWTEDEAGPYQTIPYPGSHWHPAGQAVRYPHEYVCAGTAKHLRLFHPASGQVRVKGVRKCSYAVLHPWLEAELTAILATLPEEMYSFAGNAGRKD